MAMKVDLDPKHNWRLNFHLQAPVGWLSDPNGLCHFNGEYHIFHQYAPRWCWQGHGWGHWISSDLVSWEWCGGDIIPDMPLDADGAYSGSSVVHDGQMWCYYTGNVLEPGDHDYDYSGRQANEMLCTSNDGRNFSEKRLVLDNAGYPTYCSCHVRDPKVWQQNGAWHMLLGARTRNDHGAILMYSSADGLSWELSGSCSAASGKPFGYMWECPNIAVLDGKEFLFFCPQGIPKQDFRFQNIFNSGYVPLEGTLIDVCAQDKLLMDAKAPHASIDEESFVELDYGFDFYAPQLFADENGRQLLVGWAGVPDIETEYDVPTREWSHTLTLIRELSLNQAGRICQWPAPEYLALRGDEVSFSSEAAAGATGTLGSSSYDYLNVDGAVGAHFAGTADVEIEGIEGEGRLILNHDLELTVFGDIAELAFLSHAGRFRSVRRMKLDALSERRISSLRVVVDTSIVEIYINGGEQTMTTRWFPTNIESLSVTSSFKAASTRGWEMGQFTLRGVG
ncbi:MAG: glycoside hydrolase family 32 protein [Atopobiaceae bacterium]|nr:glycoside hydrolase family 32 protein [Atopobiaceae bacterium]